MPWFHGQRDGDLCPPSHTNTVRNESESKWCSQYYDFGTAGAVAINREDHVSVLYLESIMYCHGLVQKGMVSKSILQIAVICIFTSHVMQVPRLECHQIMHSEKSTV